MNFDYLKVRMLEKIYGEDHEKTKSLRVAVEEKYRLRRERIRKALLEDKEFMALLQGSDA